MGENTYNSVAWRADSIWQSNQVDKYKALMEKLIQLEPNDWPKFQEHLKNLHLAEIPQTETQTQLKKVTMNKEIQWNNQRKNKPQIYHSS